MSIEGRCPRCTRPGPVATPCRADACVRLGVHRVPADFAREPSSDALIGQMLDAWLILRRIGAGGVGEIYLAEQRPVGLRAALKLLSGGDGPLARPERFLREAAALARLSHPNIVRLLAYGVHGARPYLVMEFIDGARTLARAGPHLAPSEKRRVVLQLTHALEAAHAQGVVHRDLKPANVMLQAVVGEPHFVRVVDFGLAKFAEDGDHTTVVAGSPHYMAPEQVARDRVGPWTDVYALGVLVLELFSGERPFRGPTVNAVLMLKSDPGYDPVAEAEESLPAGLATVLRRALAREPADRYPHPAAFRAAFEALGPMVDPPLAPTAPMRRAEAQALLVTLVADDTAPSAVEAADPMDATAPSSTPPGDGRRRSTRPMPGEVVAAAVDESPVAPAAPPRRRSGWLALLALVGIGAVAAVAVSLGPSEERADGGVAVDAAVDATVDAMVAVRVDATVDATVDAMADTTVDAMPRDTMPRDAMPRDATPPDAMPATPPLPPRAAARRAAPPGPRSSRAPPARRPARRLPRPPRPTPPRRRAP
ncbi:MAG: protein kinase [Myxococcales bacterium]|nr:protein kinase [Myxococcales bacterium]